MYAIRSYYVEEELTAGKELLPRQPDNVIRKLGESVESGPMPKRPFIIIAIVLGAATILLLDQLFTPVLLDALERVTGKSASMEVVLRAHFLFVFSHFLLILFYLLFILPVRNLKTRFLLYCLAAESIVLCAIWTLDRLDNYFWSEESALTSYNFV